MGDTPLVEDKQYLLGVIGDLPSLMDFWESSKERTNESVLSQVGVVAAALPSGSALPLPLDLGIQFPVYNDYKEMLAQHPEINMLIESTGTEAMRMELRRELPPDIALIERSAANFFIKLLVSEKLWVACKADLMQTQTLLKTLIDQLAEDILLLDRSGTVVDCNKAALERLARSKPEVLGSSFSSLLNHEVGSTGSSRAPFDKTLQTGLPAEGTLSHVDGDGRVRYFRVYTYPIENEPGELTHVVLLRRDITERTNMEHRLQQSEKLASIGELSTYIAHEIRNPLFAISGFANSLLRTEGLDESSREKLGIILEESKRLDGILRSILNFARPTVAGSGQVDLGEVVRSTMRIMGIGAEQQGIVVDIRIDEDIAKAMIDEELVKQCLINLVKNSMEAMPKGGTLTVATAMNLDHVLLSVTDTGVGIPSNVRDKVFSPFFSTKGKGSGLGLAMIRKILDDNGGAVELTSVEGKGTTVTLLFPPVLAVAQSAPNV